MGSLSEEQKQVILGCLLGDGYMRKKTNAHLQITHSVKQSEYVDWKYKIFKDLVLTPPKQYKGNAGRIGYRFFTRSLPALTLFYNLFYQHGRKVVPVEIILKPLTLAVWFMDDGSRSWNSFYLNSQKFDLQSQNNLMKALECMGITSSLHKDKKYLRLHINNKGSIRLKKLIEPCVITSMQYKLLI
ncbi:MAG: hypothetical protein HYW38_01000 [Candidatus Colwellbacteria bacterium]|nr:hypothetical protein [Candidatus Colwellbacteria bacterium]